MGIAQTIWAINPFLASLLERFVYGVSFNYKQIYGMVSMVICAACVSLSNLIDTAFEDEE